MGFILAFLGTALFSFKSVFIKLAYAQGLDTDSVLMLRMAISLPIYIAILIYLYRTKPVPIDPIRQHFLLIIFLGFIGYFLASWLDLKGLEYISAGLERLTLFTYPIFVAILGALFFKQALSRKIILSLILTYSGLWFVFSQEIGDQQEHAMLGMGLVILSALSFSFYVLFVKKIVHSMGSLWFTSIAMIVSSLFTLAYFSLFFDFSELHISNQAWLWVSLLSIVSTVIPSFMISEAIVKIGPAQTGIMGTLGPIITIILAAFILNEPFTTFHAIGMALVIVGVMLLTHKKASATETN